LLKDHITYLKWEDASRAHGRLCLVTIRVDILVTLRVELHIVERYLEALTEAVIVTILTVGLVIPRAH
jgi:hypothetical protein